MLRRSLVVVVLGALATAGCGALPASAMPHGVRVVAAESFWGAIARELGGARAQVQSLVFSPAQDPHSYEPTAADARTMATAQLAIVNGVGYDPWAPKLLAADPADGRQVLTVGSLLGLRAGDNPHRWYDPGDVRRVAAAITGRLQRLDPRHSSYYARRQGRFTSVALAGYDRLLTSIRRRYAGVAVGASESIFALLAPALGLRLITPPTFMRATAEGSELTAQDTAAVERQITTRAIAVWVVNAQNLTPEIQRCQQLARAQGIPIVSVTETLFPPTASFEQWQIAQLRRLAAALHRATGR
ncbi:MAG: zinc ABC transporter substrate-binding protein [Actinomycetota bacterium]|nr:zinc ABC transporter substrate-binding protein [Actinomycetota bacterium]